MTTWYSRSTLHAEPSDQPDPCGLLVVRATHTLYYRIANVFYWIMSNSDLHPIYDYSASLPRHGPSVRDVACHRLFASGPRYFQTVIAQQPA